MNEHARARTGSANWRYGLFTAPGAVARATTWAGITEANYSGYARQAPAYAPGAINGAGEASSPAPDLTFQHNGGGVPNTVKGWFVLDTVTTKVVACGMLAADKTMAAAGDKVILSPALYVSELP